MKISLIVAHSLNGVIGRDGQIPWHLPTDMAFFRRMTEGNIVIMGRKTYESIGRPLPNRRNIVLSRQLKSADGVECFSDMAQLEADLARTTADADDIFIIGGQEVYTRFLPQAATIYLTLVDAVVQGDAYFPRLNASWKVHLIEEHHQKPDRMLKGEWFSHRMYRLDAN